MKYRFRHTFVATLSTGATAVTSTRSLIYSYAVEAARTDGRADITSWHTSRVDAQRAANTRRMRYPDQTVRVVPTERLAYGSADAAAARDAAAVVTR